MKSRRGRPLAWFVLLAACLVPLASHADEGAAPSASPPRASTSSPEAAAPATAPPSSVDPSVMPSWTTGQSAQPPVPAGPAYRGTTASVPSKLPGYVAGGLAITSLGAGVVLGALAASDHSQFDKNPTTATANRGETRELDADLCFGIAATLAVASVVMLFSHDPPDASQPQAARGGPPKLDVAPVFGVLGLHGASVGAALRF